MATITGPGVDLSTEAVTVSAGSSAELSFPSVPVRSGLILTVRVFDADGAIVGERVVSDLALDGDQSNVTVGVAPYGAERLSLGTLVELGYSEPILSIDSVEDRLYIYAVELPTRGLYSAKLSIDYFTHVDDQPFLLYDEDGIEVGDYVDDDTSRSGFGLFTNDASEPALHYMVFQGASSWVGAEISAHRVFESSMAVLGRLSNDPVGVALIDTTNGMDLGYISPIGDGSHAEQSLRLKNISGKELTIAVCTFESGSSDAFSLPTVPATTIPPGGISEFIVRFEPTSGGAFSATLLIESDDDADIDFSMSFSGSASAG
ncbi:MAG TPA: hypothetical protein PLQ29_00750 [Spirochaetales bacterium]|nr:hypothetical protein [Spirochaetales bacterium]